MTTAIDIALDNLPAFDNTEHEIQILDDAGDVMGSLFFQLGSQDLTDFRTDCTDNSSVCTVANYDDASFDGSYMAFRATFDNASADDDMLMFCFENTDDGSQCWVVNAEEGIYWPADATHDSAFSTTAPDLTSFTLLTEDDDEWALGFVYPETATSYDYVT